MTHIVVGIGVSSLEDFTCFGERVHDEVAAASAVIALSADGHAHDLRSGEPVSVYLFDGGEGALFECCEQIKRAWEDYAGADSHLGHAAVGTFLFYWVAPDLASISALVRAGRVEELRAAARDFIAADFGAKRGPTLSVAA